MRKKIKWIASNKKIAGIQCIKLEISRWNDQEDPEVCLCCEYGEIWEYNDHTYSCVVTDCKVANDLIKKMPLPCSRARKGDELQFRFEKTRLEEVLRVLKPFVHVNHAVKKANNFGLPKNRK